MLSKRNQNWLPSLFNDFFDNELTSRASGNTPAINITESDKNYLAQLAVPGLTKEDINIHLDANNDLVITVEKKEEKKEEDEKKRYLRREFCYQKFNQTFLLPDDVDHEKINAKVDNGVLTIELPKKSEEAIAQLERKINIE